MSESMTNYETMAMFIGEETHRWNALILKKLGEFANSQESEEMLLGEQKKPIKKELLKNFLDELGHINFSIKFGSTSPKGTKTKFVVPQIFLPSGKPENKDLKNLLIDSNNIGMSTKV